MSKEKTVKIRLKEEFKDWRKMPPVEGNRQDRYLVVCSGKQPKAYSFDFRNRDEYEVPESIGKLFTEDSMKRLGVVIRCVDPHNPAAGVQEFFPVEVVTGKAKE